MKTENKKIKSKFNNDVYFLVENSPIKIIDGQQFIQVKKNLNDKESFFMLKENMEYIK